jgi:hypothetical protein
MKERLVLHPLGSEFQCRFPRFLYFLHDQSRQSVCVQNYIINCRMVVMIQVALVGKLRRVKNNGVSLLLKCGQFLQVVYKERLQNL